MGRIFCCEMCGAWQKNHKLMPLYDFNVNYIEYEHTGAQLCNANIALPVSNMVSLSHKHMKDRETLKMTCLG